MFPTNNSHSTYSHFLSPKSAFQKNQPNKNNPHSSTSSVFNNKSQFSHKTAVSPQSPSIFTRSQQIKREGYGGKISGTQNPSNGFVSSVFTFKPTESAMEKSQTKDADLKTGIKAGSKAELYAYSIGDYIVKRTSETELGLMEKTLADRKTFKNSFPKLLCYIKDVCKFMETSPPQVQKIDEKILALGINIQSILTPGAIKRVKEIGCKVCLQERDQGQICGYVGRIVKEVKHYGKVKEIQTFLFEEQKRRRTLIQEYLKRQGEKQKPSMPNIAYKREENETFILDDDENEEEQGQEQYQEEGEQSQDDEEQQQQEDEEQYQEEQNIQSSVQAQVRQIPRPPVRSQAPIFRPRLREADSDEQTAVTYDEGEEQEEERKKEAKQLWVGVQIIELLSEKKIESLQETMDDYDNSKYFHVGPRYQILGVMGAVIRIVSSGGSGVREIANGQLKLKLRQLGNKIIGLMTQQQISRQQQTISAYNSSNYFHVGPRRSLFNCVRSIINIKEQVFH